MQMSFLLLHFMPAAPFEMSHTGPLTRRHIQTLCSRNQPAVTFTLQTQATDGVHLTVLT